MSQPHLVTVEMISGHVLRFIIERPELLAEQMKAAGPEAFFDRQQIFFSHDSILAGIACDKIAFVRFHFPFDPGWTFPFDATRADLVTQETFDSQIEIKRVQIKLVLQNTLLGTPLFILKRANLVNGTTLHFRIALKTVPAMIRRQNVETAVEMRTYYAFTDDGYIVVNSQAVAYWHAFPGPLMAPEGAIKFSEQLPDAFVAQDNPMIV